MIKIVFLIAASVIIILAKPADFPVCSYKTAIQAIPPRIFAEITIDGPGQPVLITRILHNKAGIFLSETSRCYLNAFDPNFIAASTNFVGLFTFLYFIYRVTITKNWQAALVFLLLPIIPIIADEPALIGTFHKIFAIIGIILIARLKIKM